MPGLNAEGVEVCLGHHTFTDMREKGEKGQDGGALPGSRARKEG